MRMLTQSVSSWWEETLKGNPRAKSLHTNWSANRLHSWASQPLTFFSEKKCDKKMSK